MCSVCNFSQFYVQECKTNPLHFLYVFEVILLAQVLSPCKKKKTVRRFFFLFNEQFEDFEQ